MMIFWKTAGGNTIGRAFYERHGYRPDGSGKVLARLLSVSGKSVVEIRYIKGIIGGVP